MTVSDKILPLLPRLWRFALTLTGNNQDAEDLVQATCVRALERASQFATDTHLDRWLLVMMRRIWINKIRKDVVIKRKGFLLDADAARFVDGNAVAERNIYLSEVLNLIHNLPEAQREALLLVYGEELSYREAANFLEIPEGTLMSRLARGRVTLKQQLETGFNTQPDKSNRQTGEN